MERYPVRLEKAFMLALAASPRLIASRRPRILRQLLLLLTLGGTLALGVPPTQAAHSLDPSVNGHWDTPIKTPTIGIHVIVLPTLDTTKPRLFLLSGNETTDKKGEAYLWYPTTASTTSVGDAHQRTPVDNLFCSGHCFLPDGKVLFVGGHSKRDLVGIKDTNIFEAFTNEGQSTEGTWRDAKPMNSARWYPTCTTLADGSVLAISGTSAPTRPSDIPEANSNPSTNNWTNLNSLKKSLPLYPWMFVLPSGKVFNAGANRDTRLYDPRLTNPTWTQVDSSDSTNYGTRDGFASPAVAYEPGKILLMGGNEDSTGAEVINLSDTDTANWQLAGDLNLQRRRHHNATILPNGKVLVTGGEDDAGNPVLAPEIFDPTISFTDSTSQRRTGTFTTLDAVMSQPRVYHSTASLLPDGRVIVTGTNDNYTAEIYSPSYLYAADGSLAARPTIGTVNGVDPTKSYATVEYNKSFNVSYTDPGGGSISRVALIRPSSVTHSFNMDQRYVPLSFSAAGGVLSVTAPENGNMAPPGYYMLFIVNDQGVPAVANFIKLS